MTAAKSKRSRPSGRSTFPVLASARVRKIDQRPSTVISPPSTALRSALETAPSGPVNRYGSSAKSRPVRTTEGCRRPAALHPETTTSPIPGDFSLARLLVTIARRGSFAILKPVEDTTQTGRRFDSWRFAYGKGARYISPLLITAPKRLSGRNPGPLRKTSQKWSPPWGPNPGVASPTVRL